MVDLSKLTLPKGGPLTTKQKQTIVDTILSGKATSVSEVLPTDANYTAHKIWLENFFKSNKNTLGFELDQILNSNETFNNKNIKELVNSPRVPKINDDMDDMINKAYQDKLGLITDPKGALAQNYRDTMYDAISKEQRSVEQSMGSLELDAYRMLGQQQLELETAIAESRKKALRSGVTSAQLAAQQLQNMFAAQSGATQIAGQVIQQRSGMAQNFAQKRTGVETGLFDLINQQQTIGATAGAQNLASLGSFASYANQTFNEISGTMRAKQQYGAEEVNKLLDTKR